MTIIAIFLFAFLYFGLVAVILVMGMADLWKQRELEKTARMQQQKGDLAEKESRNERVTGSNTKLFRRKVEARQFEGGSDGAQQWGGHPHSRLA
jgi:hypothetical protein